MTYELKENAVHISKEFVAIFLGAWLTINGFIAALAINNAIELSSVSKAVNHVEDGENSLRQDVKEIREDMGELKEFFMINNGANIDGD